MCLMSSLGITWYAPLLYATATVYCLLTYFLYEVSSAGLYGEGSALGIEGEEGRV